MEIASQAGGTPRLKSDLSGRRRVSSLNAAGAIDVLIIEADQMAA